MFDLLLFSLRYDARMLRSNCVLSLRLNHSNSDFGVTFVRKWIRQDIHRMLFYLATDVYRAEKLIVDVLSTIRKIWFCLDWLGEKILEWILVE